MIKGLITLVSCLASSIAFAAPATDEEAAKRSAEVLALATSDKDGGYEAGKLFAECAGMYDALSLIMSHV